MQRFFFFAKTRPLTNYEEQLAALSAEHPVFLMQILLLGMGAQAEGRAQACSQSYCFMEKLISIER